MAQPELELWLVRVQSLSLGLFSTFPGIRTEFWAVVRLRKRQKKRGMFHTEEENEESRWRFILKVTQPGEEAGEKRNKTVDESWPWRRRGE